jgi:hypothetical protein
MNEWKRETYVLMYATLEANNQCNKKKRREEEKKRKTEKLWKDCSSTRQGIKSVWTRRTHTLHVFFSLDGRVVVVLSIRSFLVRTHFFVLVKRAFSLIFLFFLFIILEIELKACVTSGMINRMGKKKKRMSILEKKHTHYRRRQHLRSKNVGNKMLNIQFYDNVHRLTDTNPGEWNQSYYDWGFICYFSLFFT